MKQYLLSLSSAAFKPCILWRSRAFALFLRASPGGLLERHSITDRWRLSSALFAGHFNLIRRLMHPCLVTFIISDNAVLQAAKFIIGGYEQVFDRLIGLAVSVFNYWPWDGGLDIRHFHYIKCGFDLERVHPTSWRQLDSYLIEK